jgi:DNA mismatch repair protein MutS
MNKSMFRALKSQNPDMLLLFRMGDFYELFFEDAENGSKLLGLTLTSRNGMPMAGFPHHQLEPYLRTLLQAGQRVAVCDQVPNAPKGSPVARVVTEATAVE